MEEGRRGRWKVGEGDGRPGTAGDRISEVEDGGRSHLDGELELLEQHRPISGLEHAVVDARHLAERRPYKLRHAEGHGRAAKGVDGSTEGQVEGAHLA